MLGCDLPMVVLIAVSRLNMFRDPGKICGVAKLSKIQHVISCCLLYNAVILNGCLKYLFMLVNFLQFCFELTGTLLKIKSTNEKSMDKLLHAVLPVFSYAVTLLKMQLLNICFPSLGRVDVDHVITRKMQLIAEAEVNTL